MAFNKVPRIRSLPNITAVSILVIIAPPLLLGIDGGAWRIASATHYDEHHDFERALRLDFCGQQDTKVSIGFAHHAESMS